MVALVGRRKMAPRRWKRRMTVAPRAEDWGQRSNEPPGYAGRFFCGWCIDAWCASRRSAPWARLFSRGKPSRPWDGVGRGYVPDRSEEHTSELQSLMRTSYAAFCLKNKKQT